MRKLKYIKYLISSAIGVVVLLSTLVFSHPTLLKPVTTWVSNLTHQTTKTSNSTTSTSIDEWSYDKYPDYYSIQGDAQIDESKFDDPNKLADKSHNGLLANYTGKDNLGRTQAVYAITTLDAVKKSSAEERPDFKQGDNPSGWTKNTKVSVETSTGVYNGWFWNRSHLLADRLGGEATSNNAITGTRMQNVGNRSNSGGMYYIEEKTAQYLYEHPSNYVYYGITPIYTNDELIPRYVVVDVKSNDSVLNEHVIVYNYQNGYDIDYNTGSFTKRS